MASRALALPLVAAHRYLAAATAESTRSSYESDWKDFIVFCKAVDAPALPAAPATVAQYLAQLADRGLKSSTVTRHSAAIAFVHRRAGVEPPTEHDAVKAVLRGIRRTKGTRPEQKAPITAAVLKAMLKATPRRGLAGLRDRALLLLMFGAALRRSELVALDVAHLDLRREGVIVFIARSKSDQEGAGADVPVPEGKKLKPVTALRAWLKAAGIKRGPVFRPVDKHGRLGKGRLTGRSVARVVKRAARQAGLEEKVFSGHSGRAGFITEALDQGLDPLSIMPITRHVKVDTFKIYDRRKRSFKTHAGAKFM